MQRLARAIHQRSPLFDLAERITDQRFDLLCRSCATERQAPDLGCHDSKAATLFACTGSLDRRIHCQQVSLERDLVHCRNNVGNPDRGRIDLAHRSNRVRYDVAALLCHHPRRRRKQGGLAGVISSLTDRCRDLLHTGGSLFQTGRLLVGSTGNRIRRGTQFIQRHTHSIRSGTHLVQRCSHPFKRFIQGCGHDAYFIPGVQIEIARQVSF